MTRSLAPARALVYLAMALGAVTAPDVPRLIAMMAPARHAAVTPSFADPAAATLGWLATLTTTVLASAVGFPGLAFATTLALVGTLALVEWRARRASSPAFALGATLICAACLLNVWHVADGASTGFFFAALLIALDLRGMRGLIAVGLVTMVWCNFSATGILAVGFAIVSAFGAVLDRADRHVRMHVAAAALVAIGATLLTPAFAHFPAQAWRALALDNTLTDIVPSAPAVVAPLAYRVGLILTMVVALVFGLRATRSGDTLVFVFGAILAFANGAFIPFVGIAGAPLLAGSATRMLADVAAFSGSARNFAATALASVLAVAFGAGLIGLRTPPLVVTTVEPFDTLARYAEIAPAQRGRLFCVHLTWCDVAERSYGISVFADSRVPSASDATIAAQESIAGTHAGWSAKSRALGVDAIIAGTHSGFATLLLADRWKPYASDDTGTLFVRGAQTR